MALSKCLYCNKTKERSQMYKNIKHYTTESKTTKEKVSKTKNEYYCDEICFKKYEEIEQERYSKREIIRLICEEILCMGFNTLFVSNLRDNVYKYYQPKVVLQYLQEEKNRLYSIMNNKHFPTLHNKLSYLIAVIQNGLAKYTYKDYNEVIYGTYYEPVEITNHNNSNRNNRKKSLKDLEEEYVNEKEG